MSTIPQDDEDDVAPTYCCLDCGAEFVTAEAMNDHIDNDHNEGYGLG